MIIIFYYSILLLTYAFQLLIPLFITLYFFLSVRDTIYVSAKSLQLCPTLCDPMECSLPGFSVHGIFQARILEWAATSSSRGSSWPRDRALVSCVSFIGRRVLYHHAHTYKFRLSIQVFLAFCDFSLSFLHFTKFFSLQMFPPVSTIFLCRLYPFLIVH